LAKVKIFKDEKETIGLAKTPGHRKNRKLSTRCPLTGRLRCTASQIYIKSDSLCGKELPDDQHSCELSKLDNGILSVAWLESKLAENSVS